MKRVTDLERGHAELDKGLAVFMAKAMTAATLGSILGSALFSLGLRLLTGGR